MLKTFLVSSACCHALLPLGVRPMMTVREIFLKIVFDSPEFNRSKEDELISSTLHNRRLNILLVQHRSKFFPQQVLFLWANRQVLVFVVLLWPLIALQNHVHSILTHILRTALLRFPVRCRLGPYCSSSLQFIQAMRNSDPRVRIVLIHRHDSDSHSIFTL